MDTSPAQRPLGRRFKTLLTTSGTLLSTEERQRRYVNRGKPILSPVNAGEPIRVRSPTGTCKPFECLREVAPRSYEVLVDGAVLRRNRKDILRTSQPQSVQTSEGVKQFAWVQSVPIASPDLNYETPLLSPALLKLIM